MNTRIRRKRGKQAEIERLKKGNVYLADVIGRMQKQHEKEIQNLETNCDLMSCYLCATIIEAGGCVEFKIKPDIKEWLKGYEMKACGKNGIVHLEVRNRE